MMRHDKVPGWETVGKPQAIPESPLKAAGEAHAVLQHYPSTWREPLGGWDSSEGAEEKWQIMWCIIWCIPFSSLINSYIIIHSYQNMILQNEYIIIWISIYIYIHTLYILSHIDHASFVSHLNIFQKKRRSQLCKRNMEGPFHLASYL